MTLVQLIQMAAAAARAQHDYTAAMRAQDATRCYLVGLRRQAKRRALASLEHSMGTEHADYQIAQGAA